MSLVQSTLGLGRVGLKKIFFVEAARLDPQFKSIVGRVDTTRQEFEKYKQLAGFGSAVETPEGSNVTFDSLSSIFEKTATPIKRTKGIKFSEETAFTDQYGKIAELTPAMARAFMQTKNQAAANLDVLGFTDTTMGVNSEVLYSTSHSMGGAYTFANRPATDIAFGPLAVAQCLSEIRRQKGARGLPIAYTGEVMLKVPPELEGNLYVVLNSMHVPGSGNNDANYARTRVSGKVVDYYTSSTAWFARATDNEAHGLFLLEQLPYDLIKLEMDESLMHRWVARESYVVGWYDAHGTWGTTG